MVRKSLQLTLAILKPDVASHPAIVTHIHRRILESGFYFVLSKKLRLSSTQAELFYAEHRGKFFQSRLVSFMSSGPIWAHVLCAKDAIAMWRKMLGPTKVLKTIYSDPESIRGQFGLTDTRNVGHGSDSEETASREINFFFPEFSVEHWYKEMQSYFEHDLVDFDHETCQHVLHNKFEKSQNGGSMSCL